MYLVIYDKINGNIVGNTSLDEGVEDTLESFTEHYSEDLKVRVDSVILDELPRPTFEHKIVNGVVIVRDDLEIQELKKYGKVLSKDDRKLLKLRPSYEEVKKANDTIEMLSLLQEVI